METMDMYGPILCQWDGTMCVDKVQVPVPLYSYLKTYLTNNFKRMRHVALKLREQRKWRSYK